MAKNINEEVLKSKNGTIPAANQKQNVGIEDMNSIVDILEDLDNEGSSNLVSTTNINSFRVASTEREKLYKTFDDMSKDVVIASALELYADDATPYDTDTGHIVWVESSDSVIANMGNIMLATMEIDENAWSHVYSLCKYGDLYLETFRKSDEKEIQRAIAQLKSQRKTISESLKNGELLLEDIMINPVTDGDRIDDYIEAVSDPSTVFELTRRGKTSGFLKVKATPKTKSEYGSITALNSYRFSSDDVEIYDPTKYVHIYLKNPSDRNPEKIRIFNESAIKARDIKKKESVVESLEYTVVRGKSILYDVYKIYRELKLLEDSILLNRLTSSSMIRLLQVEVGDMGKAQVQQLLRRIKQFFEQKTGLDEGNGMNSYLSPEPVVNTIYLPTKDGKGAITSQDLGGDIEVGQLTDLDYFNNKLFAGLKIPKPFLGFMDDNAGFSGGESLIRTSARYAKTIKRIQNAYMQGIKTLLNIAFIDRGLPDYVNKFTIKMVSPNTVEDQERAEAVSTNTTIVGDIMGLLADIEDSSDRLNVLNVLLKKYVNIPDLISALEDLIEKYKTNPPQSGNEGSNDLGGGLDGFGVPEGSLGDGIDSSLDNIDSELGLDTEGESGEPQSGSEPAEEGGLPNPVDIGDVDFGDTEQI